MFGKQQATKEDNSRVKVEIKDNYYNTFFGLSIYLSLYCASLYSIKLGEETKANKKKLLCGAPGFGGGGGGVGTWQWGCYT
jgi:hypothetical protein